MVRNCDNEKDVSEIIPGLWLGNSKSAESRKFIEKYQIKYIINVTKEIPNFFENDGITYLKIPINDSDVCNIDIDHLFNDSYNFILNALKQNLPILVHCKKGHHR